MEVSHMFIIGSSGFIVLVTYSAIHYDISWCECGDDWFKNDTKRNVRYINERLEN